MHIHILYQLYIILLFIANVNSYVKFSRNFNFCILTYAFF